MLQDVPFPLLAAAFGRGAHGLRQLALGRSLSPVRSERPLPKSVGREVTFADDTNDLELLRATLLSLTDNAVAELRRKGLAARTVALKVRFNTFHTVGRRRTLARSVSATRPLYETAVALLDELGIGARWVRLVGRERQRLHAQRLPAHPRRGLARGGARRGRRPRARQVRLQGAQAGRRRAAHRHLEHPSPAQSLRVQGAPPRPPELAPGAREGA